jgi:hypothetical protein
LFELQQAVKAYDFYQRQMKKCDEQLRRYMVLVPTRVTVPAPVLASFRPSTTKEKQGRAHKSRGKNLPAFDLASELERILGVNVATIDGIDVMTIQTVLAEVRPDLSAWKWNGTGPLG